VEPTPAPISTEIPSPTVPAPPVTNGTWVEVAGWLEQRGLGPLRRRTNGAELSFEINLPQGVFALAMGSRNARWNGMIIGLGYPPKIVNGRLQAYSLDLDKHVVPLLTDGTPNLSGRIVVIDPGHGGINEGARSVYDGRREKEFTLDWARRAQPLLEAQGWQVFLTRTNDAEMTLPARAAFADAVGGSLFLSLHFNTVAPDAGPAGVETFCVTPCGLPSHLTRGFPDLVGTPLPNNAHDSVNLQLAVRLHRGMLTATSAVDRGVRWARFMDVLSPQRRPAVLLEGGFLSNPREARLIADPEYRQRLALAVAQALGPAPASPPSTVSGSATAAAPAGQQE